MSSIRDNLTVQGVVEALSAIKETNFGTTPTNVQCLTVSNDGMRHIQVTTTGGEFEERYLAEVAAHEETKARLRQTIRRTMEAI